MKIFFYFFYGEMVGCFERSDAGLQDLAHFFVFHVLEIFHVKDDALLLGEGLQCALQHEVGFVAIEIGVAFQTVDGVGFGVVDGDGVAAFLDKGEALVEGDAVEPGAEFGVAAEAVEAVPHLDECVLEYVVAVVMT